ncbi:unnamed protein product [Dibothriocephalus latus]|uniref:Uncharacterized protein n=1 Tax=Dibothriocephalus latus TaxID=60516 RepID=A0A3P7M085_DIBLA|nr:unnamed protein product [Dibothriocephalus latus]
MASTPLMQEVHDKEETHARGASPVPRKLSDARPNGEDGSLLTQGPKWAPPSPVQSTTSNRRRKKSSVVRGTLPEEQPLAEPPTQFEPFPTVRADEKGGADEQENVEEEENGDASGDGFIAESFESSAEVDEEEEEEDDLSDIFKQAAERPSDDQPCDGWEKEKDAGREQEAPEEAEETEEEEEEPSISYEIEQARKAAAEANFAQSFQENEWEKEEREKEEKKKVTSTPLVGGGGEAEEGGENARQEDEPPPAEQRQQRAAAEANELGGPKIGNGHSPTFDLTDPKLPIPNAPHRLHFF